MNNLQGPLKSLRDAADGKDQRVYSYELRDALRRKFIQCMEEDRPFPVFSQHMLNRVEHMILSLERATALRMGNLNAARHPNAKGKNQS